MAPGFEGGDAIGEVLRWLKQHQRILAEFGGPEHVSGVIEAPWPRLRIAPDASNDLAQLRWEHEAGVLVEVYADPAGTISPHRSWQLIMIALAAVAELPSAPYEPGRAVVSRVRSTTGLVPQPLSNGQYRWIAGLGVTVHPSTS